MYTPESNTPNSPEPLASVLSPDHLEMLELCRSWQTELVSGGNTEPSSSSLGDTLTAESATVLFDTFKEAANTFGISPPQLEQEDLSSTVQFPDFLSPTPGDPATSNPGTPRPADTGWGALDPTNAFGDNFLNPSKFEEFVRTASPEAEGSSTEADSALNYSTPQPVSPGLGASNSTSGASAALPEPDAPSGYPHSAAGTRCDSPHPTREKSLSPEWGASEKDTNSSRSDNPGRPRPDPSGPSAPSGGRMAGVSIGSPPTAPTAPSMGMGGAGPSRMGGASRSVPGPSTDHRQARRASNGAMGVPGPSARSPRPALSPEQLHKQQLQLRQVEIELELSPSGGKEVRMPRVPLLLNGLVVAATGGLPSDSDFLAAHHPLRCQRVRGCE